MQSNGSYFMTPPSFPLPQCGVQWGELLSFSMPQTSLHVCLDCRTLSPLGPDVPKLPSVWQLCQDWDSYHSTTDRKTSEREEKRGKERKEREKNILIYPFAIKLFRLSSINIFQILKHIHEICGTFYKYS